MLKKFFKNKIVILVAVLGVFYLIFNFQYSIKQTAFYFWKEDLKKISNTGTKIIPPPNSLTIENLNIQAPIVFAETTDEKEFQKLLSFGVVHYPGSVLPGELGNCFLFGHSSDFFWRSGKYKTVFALLPRIKIGERILVTDSAGKEYVYRVTESFSAGADRTDLLLSQDMEKKILTLQTSWPLGTALKRWIVVAELISP